MSLPGTTTAFSRPRGVASKRENRIQQILNAYVVTRYDEIIHVLDHSEIFTSNGATVPDFPEVVQPIFANRVPPNGTLLGWDNPHHDRLRASSLASEVIDQSVMKGQVELKANFALPLPLKSVIIIAGLDPERMDWIGRCLALFGGIAGGSMSIEQQVKDVLDLHDYVAQIIQERKTNRRDDLISHIWNQRDSGVVEMTDFEHLAMIPGLLLAGHETTTSVLSMGISHLLHNGRWEKANESDTARSEAIEELLRYESAITGMYRSVKTKTTLGSRVLGQGDSVFLAYNSGSRDGFGRGIHACLGAPLARLLLKTELAILNERLPNLRLITPYESIKYAKIGPGRGIEGVVVAWDPPQAIIPPSILPPITTTKSARNNIAAKIQKLVYLNPEVLEVTICSESQDKLPTWTPGSYIEVLSEHGYRQYSLCSDSKDTSSWKIAIRKEMNGSGGVLFAGIF